MQHVIDLLASVGIPFVPWGWSPKPCGDYGVVSLLDSDLLLADNGSGERASQYTVDAFTRDGSETVRRNVEAALASLPVRLDYAEFEEDTGYLHLQWVVSVYG